MQRENSVSTFFTFYGAIFYLSHKVPVMLISEYFPVVWVIRVCDRRFMAIVVACTILRGVILCDELHNVRNRICRFEIRPLESTEEASCTVYLRSSSTDGARVA